MTEDRQGFCHSIRSEHDRRQTGFLPINFWQSMTKDRQADRGRWSCFAMIRKLQACKRFHHHRYHQGSKDGRACPTIQPARKCTHTHTHTLTHSHTQQRNATTLTHLGGRAVGFAAAAAAAAAAAVSRMTRGSAWWVFMLLLLLLLLLLGALTQGSRGGM